jgi:hypothetical protein
VKADGEIRAERLLRGVVESCGSVEKHFVKRVNRRTKKVLLCVSYQNP